MGSNCPNSDSSVEVVHAENAVLSISSSEDVIPKPRVFTSGTRDLARTLAQLGGRLDQ
jgi:hypothetical protein